MTKPTRMLSCEPTWTICVFQNPQFPERVAHLRTVIQFDLLDANGHNHESTNPTELRRRGYFVPDWTHLAQGRYTVGDLMRAIVCDVAAEQNYLQCTG